MSNAALVDKYGKLKAKVAKLNDQLKALEVQLKALNLREIEGDFYRATVSLQTRTTLDSARIKAEQPKIYLKYAQTSDPFKVLKCVSKIVK